MKDLVEGPNTPVTSTATGSNIYLSVKQEYFVLLSSSAAAAADPGAMAELMRDRLQKVLTHVASHARRQAFTLMVRINCYPVRSTSIFCGKANRFKPGRYTGDS